MKTKTMFYPKEKPQVKFCCFCGSTRIELYAGCTSNISKKIPLPEWFEFWTCQDCGEAINVTGNLFRVKDEQVEE